MLADLLPLLGLAAIAVLARNLFEMVVLERAERHSKPRHPRAASPRPAAADRPVRDFRKR